MNLDKKHEIMSNRANFCSTIEQVEGENHSFFHNIVDSSERKRRHMQLVAKWDLVNQGLGITGNHFPAFVLRFFFFVFKTYHHLGVVGELSLILGKDKNGRG